MWFDYILVAVVVASDYSGSTVITGSESEVTVYRLKTSHPWATFRDDQPTGVADTLDELIMAHDHERESLLSKTQHNFQEKMDATPYYVIDQKDNCKESNGNCSQKCETVGYQTVCSCVEGYTLTSTTGCSMISGCDIRLSGTSGKFTVDKDYCHWTIKAPDHQIIEVNLHISKIEYYDEYDEYDDDTQPYAEVHDGDSTAASVIKQVRYGMGDTAVRSSGQTLLIKSHHGWSQNRYTMRVSYVTGSQYLQAIPDPFSAELVLPVSSLPADEMCLSLTYSIEGYGSLSVSLEKGDDVLLQIAPEHSFERQDRKWQRKLFRIPFHQGAKELKFRFTGTDVRVYNLGRCLNLEYHAVGGQRSLGTTGTVCRNGGVWSDTTQSCACPPGFVGAHCEEGCGPNSYGENCSQRCSFLSSDCEGMIFCTKKSCSCASGLRGPACNSSCEPGYYGASCHQKCGKCESGKHCEQYTGICYTGCSPGYYPPFCQQTYKVLKNPPDIIAVSYNTLKIRIPFGNVEGEGEAALYEVQYKNEKQDSWMKLSPRVISTETEFEIMGLLPGKVYETRIILVDKDGGRYQTDVPKAKARTKCIDPHQGDYSFAVKDVGERSVVLEWSYEHDDTSLVCEIVYFELSVICGDERYKFSITETQGSKLMSDMAPITNYTFQLVGKTVTGGRTLGKEAVVQTLPAAPRSVRAAKAVPLASGRQLNVTWLPPWNSQDRSLRYSVAYQCLSLLACENISCYTSSGEIEVSATSAVLDNLQPHAQYQIEITSVSTSGLVSGRYKVIATTAQAAPHVSPAAAETSVLSVSNTSVLLTWMPPEDCTGLNGYIYGYSYALVENETGEIIRQGTVPENILSVNFSGLAPSHCYDAHITVVSSGGDSVSNLLIIPFCTRSTAPDRVQSLSVYKRGRRMVGLRWSPPRNTYGDIEFFTVTYSTDESSGHGRALTTQPAHCGAWPDLYCYTVSGLSPGKRYRFEVRARNKEVNVDGEPAAVEAVTSEGASSAPLNLRIVNTTESSMLLMWGMPYNVNGQLRSFIIIVEQIDTQVNSQECCDDIRLQDYRVTSEEPFYQYEITGLSAASTYSVTVSAKTVTLGEESRVIGHTYPPNSRLPQNALTVVKVERSGCSPDVVTLRIRPAERINSVNRTYILLYLTNESITQLPFHDNELTSLLQSRFTENYHLISEYTQEEVENQPEVAFSLRDLGLASAETQSQKFALVLMQDYLGNRNVDTFIIDNTGV